MALARMLEGWPESNEGDERCDKFISWLDEQRWEDKSCPFDYAEVQYGDESGRDKVLRSGQWEPKNALERLAEKADD